MGLRAVWLVAAPVLVMVVVFGGCGGGSNGQVPTGGGGGGVAGAVFVGRTVCAVCHSEISNEFSNTAHGQDFSQPVHGIDFMTQSGGACQPCHVVGLGEPGGFVSPTVTPQFIGVGCEDCHGPGSKHAGGPTTTTINKLPRAEDTCWGCHVNSYRILDKHPGSVGDSDLLATAANKVGPHHPQALFLNGVLTYGQPVTPSPHSLIDNTCVSCHLNPDQGIVSLAVSPDPIHGEGALAPDLPTCVPCHGSQSASKTLFTNYESEVTNKLIELGGVDPANPGSPDPACGGGLLAAYVISHSLDITTNTSAQQADPYMQAYKGARYNYEFIINDRSSGAHNPPLTDSMLAAAKTALTN